MIVVSVKLVVKLVTQRGDEIALNMDVEKLIRKCQEIALKEEEDDIVTFMGRMKIKREKIVANCLFRKVLLT